MGFTLKLVAFVLVIDQQCILKSTHTHTHTHTHTLYFYNNFDATYPTMTNLVGIILLRSTHTLQQLLLDQRLLQADLNNTMSDYGWLELH